LACIVELAAGGAFEAAGTGLVYAFVRGGLEFVAIGEVGDLAEDTDGVIELTDDAKQA
jgi:hypothetical protein